MRYLAGLAYWQDWVLPEKYMVVEDQYPVVLSRAFN